MNDSYIYDDSLYHYGRSKRDGAPVGSGRYPLGSGDSATIKQYRKAQKEINARRATLSDDELNAMINRLRQENQLNSLYLENNPAAKASKAGQNAVMKGLANSGTKILTNVASTLITGAALFAAYKVISKKDKDAAAVITSGSVKPLIKKG